MWTHDDGNKFTIFIRNVVVSESSQYVPHAHEKEQQSKFDDNKFGQHDNCVFDWLINLNLLHGSLKQFHLVDGCQWS